MNKNNDAFYEDIIDEIALRGDLGISKEGLVELISRLFPQFHTSSLRHEFDQYNIGNNHDVSLTWSFQEIWNILTAHPDIFLSIVNDSIEQPATVEENNIPINGGVLQPLTSQNHEPSDVLLFATQYRRWRTITGEANGYTRLRHLDMQTLSAIALARENGILQSDLHRSTFQDRKVLSDKLKRLQHNGYIIKTTAVVKSTITSRVFITRFHRDYANSVAPKSEIAILEDAATQPIHGFSATASELTSTVENPEDLATSIMIDDDQRGNNAQALIGNPTGTPDRVGHTQNRPVGDNLVVSFDDCAARDRIPEAAQPPVKRKRGRPRKDPNAPPRPLLDNARKDANERVARFSLIEDHLSEDHAFHANTLTYATYLTGQALSPDEMFKEYSPEMADTNAKRLYSDLFFHHRNAIHVQLMAMSIPGLYINPPIRLSRSELRKRFIIVFKSSRLLDLDCFRNGTNDTAGTHDTHSTRKKLSKIEKAREVYNFSFISSPSDVLDRSRLASIIRMRRTSRDDTKERKFVRAKKRSRSWILPFKLTKGKNASRLGSRKNFQSQRKPRSQSRPEMTLEIIRKAGGVFPGIKEMYYPLKTAVQKLTPNATFKPLMARKMVHYLEAQAKIYTIVFAYRGQGGIPRTTKLLLLPSVNVDSYAVRTIQNRIIQSDPYPYLPESVEIDADLREQARMDFENRRLRTSDDLSDQPHMGNGTEVYQKGQILDSEHTAMEFAFQLNIGTGDNARHRKRVRLNSKAELTHDLNVNTEEITLQAMINDVNAPGHLIPTCSDNRSPNPNPEPALYQRVSAIAPFKSSHTPDARFSTKMTTSRRNRPALTVNPGLQKSFEDKLPSSIDDILSGPQSEEIELSRQMDISKPESIFTSTQNFHEQVERVRKWEADNQEILVSGGSLIQSRFINHTIIKSPNIYQSDDQETDHRKKKKRSKDDWMERPKRKYANQKRGRDATLTSQIRTSMRPRDPRKRNQHSVPLTDCAEPIPSNTAAGAAGVDSWLPVPRGPKNTNLFTGAKLRHFLTAVIVIRTIVGGIERRIDWALLGMLFPHLAHHNLEYRWRRAYISQKRELDKVQNDFQQAFLSAYERRSDEIPEIDFNDMQNFDWHKLINWALVVTDTSRLDNIRDTSESHSPAPVFGAPTSNEQVMLPIDLDKIAVHVDTEDHQPSARDEFYHTARPNVHRIEILKEASFSMDVTQPIATSQSPFDDPHDGAIRTTVRSNLLTPEHIYNPSRARAALAKFDDRILTSSLNELLGSKLFKKQNKGRYMPGRNYAPAEQFWVGYRQAFDVANIFQAAAKFKFKLDAVFAEHGKMDLPFYWSDAENLVILNLMGAGRVTIQSLIPPVSTDTRTFQIDAHGNRRLSIWGFTRGGYKTAKIDRSELVFPLRVIPTNKYIDGIPLPNPFPAVPLTSQPLAPQSPSKIVGTETLQEDTGKAEPKHKSQKEERVPLWISIHGAFLSDMWNMLLSVVVTLIALRPGNGPSEIAKLLKGGVGEWEVRLVLEWLRDVGVAEQINPTVYKSGWRAKEWWWTIFGPFHATTTAAVVAATPANYLVPPQEVDGSEVKGKR